MNDKPGECPSCGMRLEPVDAEGHPAGTRAGIPEGTLEIGLARQQLMGVHTEEVKRTAISHRLRVPGRVAPDEGRVYPLIAAAEGWIRNLGQNPAGTFVKKDQILASYYTPNFQTSRQGLLFGANADRPGRGEPAVASQRQPAALSSQIAIERL